MKRLISTVTLTVALALPAVALASGQLAPKQASTDGAAACEGSIEGDAFAYPAEGLYELAAAWCNDRYARHYPGRTQVTWYRNRFTGERFTARDQVLDDNTFFAIDATWVPVPSYVPVLDCIRVLDDRELCGK